MNIGVFLPNWIGDAAMATPLLRGLRRYYGPEAHIVGVMKPYVAEVFSGSPWLSDILFYNRRSKDRSHRGGEVIRRLKLRQLDVAFLLPNSLRAALLAWRAGAVRRIGYARYGRGPLLSERLAPPREGRRLAAISAVDYYRELGYAAGLPPQSRGLELFTTRAAEREADQILDKLGFGAEAPVLLNTGGAYGAAKDWPAEHFATLARQIAVEQGWPVLVLCGPAERAAAARIATMAGHRRVKSLAGCVPKIGGLKAIIRRGRALVSTDSGPRHLAAAFGVPTIALFGPIDPRWSINYSPVETRLSMELDCQPCGRRVCPLGHHRCMRELSASRVHAQLLERLNTPVVAAVA